MEDRKCWTIPQLLLDLQARVEALEKTTTDLNATIDDLAERLSIVESNKVRLYEHNVYFEFDGESPDNGSIAFRIYSDSDTALTTTTLTTLLTSLPDGTRYDAAGFTNEDSPIVYLEKSSGDLLGKLPDSSSILVVTIRAVHDDVTTVTITPAP